MPFSNALGASSASLMKQIKVNGYSHLAMLLLVVGTSVGLVGMYSSLRKLVVIGNRVRVFFNRLQRLPRPDIFNTRNNDRQELCL
jgi:hypothetical protein